MDTIFRILAGFFFLTTVVAVGFVLAPKRPDPELEKLKISVSSLSKELDSLKADKAKMSADFARERQEWEQERIDLDARLAKARSSGKAAVPAAQPAPKNAGNVDLSKVPQEDLRRAMRDQFLNDPEKMKEAKQNARRMIDQYGGILLKKLKLDAAAEEKFKDLWAERGIYWFTGRFSGDEQSRAEMDAKVQEIDAQVASLLGSQYEIYEDYNQKQFEYMQVNALQGRLGEENAMNDEQIDSLAGLMYEARQDNPTKNWWEMSQEERAQAEEKRKENNQKVIEQSKSFLNEAQVKALEESFSRGGRWGGGFWR